MQLPEPPISADDAKERFEICKTCPDASNKSFKCKHRKGCCFGRWRAMLSSQCPLDKWPEIIEERIHNYG